MAPGAANCSCGPVTPRLAANKKRRSRRTRSDGPRTTFPPLPADRRCSFCSAGTQAALPSPCALERTAGWPDATAPSGWMLDPKCYPVRRTRRAIERRTVSSACRHHRDRHRKPLKLSCYSVLLVRCYPPPNPVPGHQLLPLPLVYPGELDVPVATWRGHTYVARWRILPSRMLHKVSRLYYHCWRANPCRSTTCARRNAVGRGRESTNCRMVLPDYQLHTDRCRTAYPRSAQ